MPHSEFDNSEFEYKIRARPRSVLDFLQALKDEGRLLPLSSSAKGPVFFELHYPDEEDHYPAEKAHYDTRDFVIGESHNILRVRKLTEKKAEKLWRREGLRAHYKQVVKSHGDKEGDGFAREEKKGFLRSKKPSFAAIPDPSLRAQFAGISNRKLKKIFTTDTRRIICNVQLGERPDEYAELAFDVGHERFKKQGVQVPISILEPEQKGNCSRAMLDAFKDEILLRVPGSELQGYTNGDLGYSVVLHDNPEKLESVLGDRAVDLSTIDFEPYEKPKDNRLGVLQEHKKHQLVWRLA